MIDQMVNTIIKRVKDQYPGVAIPAAMRAVITSAAESGNTYRTDCTILCMENGNEYHCQVERKCYIYTVKVLSNSGDILEQYPELIEIESRQQLQVGDMVQVVFLGNELEAAIVGG